MLRWKKYETGQQLRMGSALKEDLGWSSFEKKNLSDEIYEEGTAEALKMKAVQML